MSSRIELVVVILTLVLAETSCKCRQSYVMRCDSFTDLKRYNAKNWTELVIGTKDPNPYQRFYTLDNNFMDNFEALESLTIFGQLNDINIRSYYNYHLEYLNLYGNVLEELDLWTFRTYKKLRRINLQNNKIKLLTPDPHTNDNLQELMLQLNVEVVDLSRNEITLVDSKAFYFSSIKKIAIRENQLKTLGAKAFPNSLKVLNLDYNKLEDLQSEALENLVDLVELTLSHNKLKEVPDLTALKRLWTLDLSYNGIRTIDGKLAKLERLTSINLNNNQIESLSLASDLPRMETSVKISLAYNRLTNLSFNNVKFRRVFHIKNRRTSAGVTLSLFGNPWNCECLRIMEQFIRKKDIERSKCDLELFKDSSTPFCIGQGDCKDKKVDEDSYRKFLDLLENKEIHCDLD